METNDKAKHSTLPPGLIDNKKCVALSTWLRNHDMNHLDFNKIKPHLTEGVEYKKLENNRIVVFQDALMDALKNKNWRKLLRKDRTQSV